MFPRPLMPASFVSVQAVLPPKSQGDIGLDGNPLGPPVLAGVRRHWPGSAVPPSGLEKQRQWGCRWPGQEGPCPVREQLWCVKKGKLKLILCKLKHLEKTASSEWRGAMESSVYLQLLFPMGGWEESWGHCPKGGLQPCPVPSTCSLCSVLGVEECECAISSPIF